MIHPSATHLVLIPSFDGGPRLTQTVREALAAWAPVWVVIDGSRDGSEQPVMRLAESDANLRVIRRATNGGKGAAVLTGLTQAAAAGFSHVLVMDGDGQHPASHIALFMAASAARPAAMVAGVPRFSEDAPALRVKGRKISNWWVRLETPGAALADSLFGFRVYPVAPLLRIMQSHVWMRRFDFDPEAAVRLIWAGCPVVNLEAPVRYLQRSEGGVSHFRYGRDNALLTWMHVRLVLEAAWRRLRQRQRL